MPSKNPPSENPITAPAKAKRRVLCAGKRSMLCVMGSSPACGDMEAVIASPPAELLQGGGLKATRLSKTRRRTGKPRGAGRVPADVPYASFVMLTVQTQHAVPVHRAKQRPRRYGPQIRAFVPQHF